MHVAVAASHETALAALVQEMALRAQSRFVESMELQRIIRPEDVGRIDEGLRQLRAEAGHNIGAFHIASRGKGM